MSRKLPRIEAEYEKRLKESDRKWSARVDLQKRRTKTVQNELNQVQKRLNAVIRELQKYIITKCRTCKCALNGEARTFRGEPCYWHKDCGVSHEGLFVSDLCRELLQKATGEKT